MCAGGGVCVWQSVCDGVCVFAGGGGGVCVVGCVWWGVYVR